ncbi:MAG: hypothetical protein ABI646_07310 [Acidobacteriota bacterium]
MWRLNDEDTDDKLAEVVNRNVDALTDRRTLLRYLSVLGIVNVLIWLSVLIFPVEVRDGFTQVWQTSDTVAKIVLALVFGLGMWLSYSLFRLKFPDIEEQRLDADVMASFHFQSNSSKRFAVWVLSVVGGILNLALLIFAVLARSE